MYKGNQPSTKNTAMKPFNSQNNIKKKSATVSKDKATTKFSSFNNVVQNNQSIDLNSSKRNSPGNSMILNGVGNNLSSKLNKNKYSISYAALHQEKLNKTKNSKEDSINLSKRLPTNSSINLYNSNNNITEENNNSQFLQTANKTNPNEKNYLYVQNKGNKNVPNTTRNNSTNNVNINFPKPPINTNNYNSNNNINKNISIVQLNFNDANKTSSEKQQQPQHLSRRESSENNINLNINNPTNTINSDIKNKTTVQNNFTFNNNNLHNSNVNVNTNNNTNGNVLTGNNNNLNTAANVDNANSNLYLNSKNSKKNDTDKITNTHPNSSQNVSKNNSANKAKGNLVNSKLDSTKKFAQDIAISKGKKNIYDMIKNTSTKKPTTNTSKNNNSLSSVFSNQLKKAQASTEVKIVSNDKETSFLNLNNSQNQENLYQRNSKNLKNNNKINPVISSNFSPSPLKPVKNDQNPFTNLNGSLRFSLSDLNNENKEDANTDEKSAEFFTGEFNRYRKDTKVNNNTTKKASVDFTINDNKKDNNIGNTNNNTNKKNDNHNEKNPQEDDFNFNYNDEKIYSENLENSRKEFVEDDLEDFKSDDNKDKNIIKKDNNNKNENENNNVNSNANNSNNANKFHIRAKSNNYFSNEPLTSIEEIDEKHNLQNTEENVKSNKDNSQKEDFGLTYFNRKTAGNELILNNLDGDLNNKNKDSETKRKSSNNTSVNNPLTNFNFSPTKKSYKNEIDESFSNMNPLNINNNPEEKNKENSKAENKKGFELKDDYNINKSLNLIQNLTNNISPINNIVDNGINKKVLEELNLNPNAQLKDNIEIYKKGRVTRKSNELDDLITLNNLIEVKLNGKNNASAANIDKNPINSKIVEVQKQHTNEKDKNQVNSKADEVQKQYKPNSNEKDKNPVSSKAVENQKQEKPSVNEKDKIQSPKSDKTVNNDKKPESSGNESATKVANKSSSLKSSIEKKSNLKTSLEKPNQQTKSFNKSTTLNNQNKNSSSSPNNNFTKNRKNSINNASTIRSNREGNNSILNKDGNSFLDDLGSKNSSKILNTYQSRNLKTGGDELNSSKTFNKLLIPKDAASSAIAAAKNMVKQVSLGIKEKTVSTPSRPSAGKSNSWINNPNNRNNKSGLKNNSSKLGSNTTVNLSTLGDKKRGNFISKTKLQNIKPNQSDLQSTLSKKAILGKIFSTRNIKGDDRARNLLTEIDKGDSIEVSPTLGNMKRNPFNSLSSRMSSLRESYDFDFDRRFSSSLRSEDYSLLKKRNTKSFPERFNKGNFYKKNSMILLPDNQNDGIHNKSANSIPGSGPCDNIKIRINENHILSRTKLIQRNKKFKYDKGKYELLDSFDASFNLKRNYHPNELIVSPVSHIVLNDIDKSKDIIIHPPNLRKEQKDEINQKLSEKLQGNFIDESITKITKMNRLERMKNNRYSSTSVSPSRVMNNFCFSPLGQNSSDNNTNNKRTNLMKKNSEDEKRSNILSDRTLKYSSNMDESNNNINTSIIKAQKKIGNSKVVLMENNFVICTGDEEKIFSPFDSDLENNFNRNNHNTKINNPPVDYLEITNLNKQRLDKINKLEKISNSVFDITKKYLKNQSKNSSPVNRLNQINNINNINDSVVVESAGFTIAHLDNVKIENDLDAKNGKKSKIVKILKAQNVINLFYQMHPEKNKFGFYSFNNNQDDLTSNAFSLLKSNKILNNNQLQNLNNSLLISNPVNESINCINNSISANNSKKILFKLDPQNNNFELDKNNPNKNLIKYSNLNKKGVNLNLPESGTIENNQNDEYRGLGYINNENIYNLKDPLKKDNNNMNIVNAITKNNNLAVNKILVDPKSSFADNIRKNKENFNGTDFFDRIKTFLEAKRIETHVIEQGYLNSESNINKSFKNLTNLTKLDVINRSKEKENSNINDMKPIISRNDNDIIKNSYNTNNLVISSSLNRIYPYNSLVDANNNTNIKNNNYDDDKFFNFKNNKSFNNNLTQNPSNNVKESLNKLNEIEITKNLDSKKLVHPMNDRNKTNLRVSTEQNEKNCINDANLELLSEKLKKEKQIEALNQRFQERLNSMKNTKQLKSNLSSFNTIENFHDFEFENFKNEFKNNYIQNGFSSNEKKSNKNLNCFNNLNSSDYIEARKDEILISDEKLSEFKDKLGKFEFIDKSNVKMFYTKYLKGVNKTSKLKNFLSLNKQEKLTNFSESAKKEQELNIRLEKLKGMLNIDDPKKSKESKHLISQNFLYEKNDRSSHNNILNNLNSSTITNTLNLNESRINNVNYISNGSGINSLKMLGNLSSNKFGNSIGSSSNTPNNVFGNINNSVNKRVWFSNQVIVGNSVNSSKNELIRDLKYNL